MSCCVFMEREYTGAESDSQFGPVARQKIPASEARIYSASVGYSRTAMNSINANTPSNTEKSTA